MTKFRRHLLLAFGLVAGVCAGLYLDPPYLVLAIVAYVLSAYLWDSV